jgi:hypothetical protein
MSGAHRLAVGEITLAGKSKKGKEYLDMVNEEMTDPQEGSKEDLAHDAKEEPEEVATIKNI